MSATAVLLGTMKLPFSAATARVVATPLQRHDVGRQSPTWVHGVTGCKQKILLEGVWPTSFALHLSTIYHLQLLNQLLSIYPSSIALTAITSPSPLVIIQHHLSPSIGAKCWTSLCHHCSPRCGLSFWPVVAPYWSPNCEAEAMRSRSEPNLQEQDWNISTTHRLSEYFKITARYLLKLRPSLRIRRSGV